MFQLLLNRLMMIKQPINLPISRYNSSKLQILKRGAFEMSTTNTSYRTGEQADREGDYICEAGRRITLKEGDKFPYCPVTGIDTNWYYAES